LHPKLQTIGAGATHDPLPSQEELPRAMLFVHEAPAQVVDDPG